MKRRFFTAMLLSLVVSMLVSISWAGNANDGVFDWLESKFPEYVSPSGSPSTTVGNYYFRYYPETNSHLGVDVTNNHLYYLGPMFDGLWDLGLSMDWQAQVDQDNALFDWLEAQYPEYISPAGQPSTTIANYYFRYYPATNSYLGLDSKNNHVYYLGPLHNGLLDLGLASYWHEQMGTTPTDGSEEEVRILMNSVMALATNTATDGLMDQVELIMAGVLSGSTPSSCPVVSTNLDIAALMGSGDLAAALAGLPSTITASADYGSGCRAADGSFFSGDVGLAVNSLRIDPNSGNISFTMEARVNNLAQDSKLIGNGVMSGSLNANLMSEAINADIRFNNFIVSNGQHLDGIMTLNALGGVYKINLDVTSDGVYSAKLALVMTEITNGDDDDDFGGVFSVSSTSGSVNGYDVKINNLIIDSDMCEQYPVGGSIVFTKNGKSWTTTFDNSCNGSYHLY
ncbi:MAG: hypothetical protein PHH87_00525 [Desulfuromonas sp.]|nr:hypothetical protein [Desulfuromonas sp.]